MLEPAAQPLIRTVIVCNVQNRTQLVKTDILLSRPWVCPSSLGCLCWRPALPLHTYLGGKREPGKPTPKLLLGAGLELRSLPLAWSPWLGLRAASAVVGPGCCHPTFQCRYCGPGCLGGEATAPLTLRAHLPVVIALLRSSASELCMQNSWNCSWEFLM